MIFKKNDLEEKLGFNNEERKIIMGFQKKLPIITEDGEGFCVDARELHKQLTVGRDFSTWIKGRIKKYDFKEELDYKLTDTKTGERKNVVQYNYNITLNMAKELSMIENNEVGKIARKYFILMEKALNKMVRWNKIRYPEKKEYKILCSELNKYLERNFNKKASYYDYINEANSLNLVCLGARAKDIREYLQTQDINTREHLDIEYNTYLAEMQKLDIMYLRMNISKIKRYDMIQQGFKALYPNASFIIANRQQEECN